MVKNVNFELSFQQLSKFLDFAKFHPSKIQSGQTLNLRQIFTATENFWILPNFILPMFWVVKNVSFLDFAKFHPSHVAGGQKCQFLAKFLTWIKMLTLQNVILRRSGVVKLLISSQILNTTENIWILPNFILRRSGVVKNLIFEPNFQHKSKFS